MFADSRVVPHWNMLHFELKLGIDPKTKDDSCFFKDRGRRRPHMAAIHSSNGTFATHLGNSMTLRSKDDEVSISQKNWLSVLC